MKAMAPGLLIREYQVPTLIARDGVHPSNPAPWVSDYSPEGLQHNGCTLRDYLTLLATTRSNFRWSFHRVPA
jgi:hypothetical protein